MSDRHIMCYGQEKSPTTPPSSSYIDASKSLKTLGEIHLHSIVEQRTLTLLSISAKSNIIIVFHIRSSEAKEKDFERCKTQPTTSETTNFDKTAEGSFEREDALRILRFKRLSDTVDGKC